MESLNQSIGDSYPCRPKSTYTMRLCELLGVPMWCYKSLAWVGGGTVLVIMLVAMLSCSQSPHDPSTPLRVEARCGVASGGKIAGKHAQITCGLTTAEIEAVIARAVTTFDLPAPIDQAQNNQIRDLKAIE